MLNRAVILGLTILVGVITCVRADDPPTHEIQPGPFHKDVILTGQAEPVDMAEIRADFRQFTALKVKQVVPDGSPVAAGDVVMWIDDRDFLRQRKIKGLDREVAELAHEIAKFEFQKDETSQQLELHQLIAQVENLMADRDYFLEVQHPKNVESIDKSRGWSEDYLEDQREELRQLEQMYLEDELVEESEELVLRRTRRSIEQSEFYAEQSRESTRRQLEVLIPRELRQREVAFDLERLRLDAQIQSAEINLKRRRLAWEKAQVEYGNTWILDFDEFLEDGIRLEVRAPITGIFVYGEIDRGLLTGQRRWREGDTINVNQVIGTVYTDFEYRLRADMPEDVTGLVQVGQSAWVSPKAQPNQRIPANVTSVGRYALPTGMFDCTLNLASSTAFSAPAMKAEVRIRVFESDKAIAVPSKAVFTDDDWNYYVYVKTGDAIEKRTVERGLIHQDQTLIVSGLAAGDVILLEKPK
ncbi:MAG TPA: hypothetical protein PKD54_00635 [Pirellulaceae bacterium]|nr:hypothetical protein [Pirellulaceae bacterium]